MPFKLISLKQCGAVLKVIFDIRVSYNYNDIYETDVNVYNLAVITFRQRKYTAGDSDQRFCIKTKKTESARDLQVTLSCSKGDANKQIKCLVEWSDFHELNFEKCNNLNSPYVVNIAINVSRVISPLDEQLHEDMTFTDFELSADDGTVSVHKAVLAAHSDVFKTMLLGSWKETKEGRIEVEGVTSQTLQHLKDYVYLGTLPDPDDGLQPLLLLAMRYLMDTLKVECVFKLSKNVTEDNLHDMLKFAIQNENHELLNNLLQNTPHDVLNAALNKKGQITDCIKSVFITTDSE